MLHKNSVKILGVLALAVILANCASEDNQDSQLLSSSSDDGSSGVQSSSSSPVFVASSSSLAVSSSSLPAPSSPSSSSQTSSSSVISSSSSGPGSSSSMAESNRSSSSLGLSNNSSSSLVSSSSLSSSSSSSSAISSSSTTECPIYNSGTHFCDSRDGKVYKYVEIGSQIWLAENLNYNAEGSRCYNNQNSYCNTYGRLYNWSMAMSACPQGWHLPNTSDWYIFINYVQTDNGGTYTLGENASIAGKYLKAVSGWNSNGNGEDKYGFAATPGGCYSSLEIKFSSVGSYGYLWSASASEKIMNAYYVGMNLFDPAYWNSDDKREYFSVRCLKD